jgi:hypothetical protein
MKQYRDPITGDALTLGEYVSWQIQSIVRRWLSLIIIILITALCWATNNPIILTWWNLAASLLAIIIEFIVGLSMLGQTRRDACILREIRAIDNRIESIIRHIQHTVDIEQQDIEAIMERKQ